MPPWCSLRIDTKFPFWTFYLTLVAQCTDTRTERNLKSPLCRRRRSFHFFSAGFVRIRQVPEWKMVFRSKSTLTVFHCWQFHLSEFQSFRSTKISSPNRGRSHSDLGLFLLRKSLQIGPKGSKKSNSCTTYFRIWITFFPMILFFVWFWICSIEIWKSDLRFQEQDFPLLDLDRNPDKVGIFLEKKRKFDFSVAAAADTRCQRQNFKCAQYFLQIQDVFARIFQGETFRCCFTVMARRPPKAAGIDCQKATSFGLFYRCSFARVFAIRMQTANFSKTFDPCLCNQNLGLKFGKRKIRESWDRSWWLLTAVDVYLRLN